MQVLLHNYAGDVCDPTACFYSTACRCSSLLLTSKLIECNKTTTVIIEGISIKITHYKINTPGKNGIEQNIIMTIFNIIFTLLNTLCTKGQSPSFLCVPDLRPLIMHVCGQLALVP